MRIKKEHKKHLDAIESELSYDVSVSVECPVCGEEESIKVDHVGPEWMRDAAVELLHSGWRLGANHEHQLQGVLCQCCFQGEV